MPETPLTLNRRQFALGTLAAAAAASMPSMLRAASSPATRHKFCAFTKYLQSLSDEELAAGIAAAGFDGVEVPVRKEGHEHHARKLRRHVAEAQGSARPSMGWKSRS